MERGGRRRGKEETELAGVVGGWIWTDGEKGARASRQSPYQALGTGPPPPPLSPPHLITRIHAPWLSCASSLPQGLCPCCSLSLVLPHIAWSFTSRGSLLKCPPSMRPSQTIPLLPCNSSLRLIFPKHLLAPNLLCLLPNLLYLLSTNTLEYELHLGENSYVWFSAVSPVLQQCLAHNSSQSLFTE